MGTHTKSPVRDEPVEASAHGMLVFPIILRLSKDGLRMHGHFDKLSANRFVCFEV